jgi:LuxR family maltose regulon positive regulatory protein
MTIALASRAELALPVARLRAQGLLTELRAADLAMTRAEAAALCKGAELRLEGERLDDLMRRTEGWPVAVALAAQALAHDALAIRRGDGGERQITEFLRDEVLAGLDADEREFVQRTAILDELSAPLCDAILEGSGSAAMLTRLQQAGFPLVALDRTGERHRHHHLLRETLLSELQRSAPAVEAALHRRASDWHARVDEIEPALHHALAAREIARAGELVWAGVPRSLESGTRTVERWLGLFGSEQLGAHALLALTAAATQLAYGQGDVAEHWLLAAAAAPSPRAQAGLVSGGVTVLRAALGRDGLLPMRAQAERASALLTPDSPGQALCHLLCGVAEQLRGEGDGGRARLEDGARRAAVRSPHVQALCLAQLALLALDRHDPEDAARLVSRARAQIERHGLERLPTSALVLAVSALVRALRGRAEEATRELRAATELAGRLTDIAPWYELEVTIVLARAAVRLSDVVTARARLADAQRLAARLPDATVLEAWRLAAETAVGRFGGACARTPASLTAAELRILQFLPTHLSFREIGERTNVTANTVKTQVNAAYRKLDVRSRSEAVDRARALGLLEA